MQEGVWFLWYARCVFERERADMSERQSAASAHQTHFSWDNDNVSRSYPLLYQQPHLSSSNSNATLLPLTFNTALFLPLLNAGVAVIDLRLPPSTEAPSPSAHLAELTLKLTCMIFTVVAVTSNR